MKNRPIKKIGNSWFIRLAPIDCKDYNLIEGDMIDLEPSLFIYLQNKNKETKGGKKQNDRSIYHTR